MKGSERNAPCPCGSGKKAKKCHQHVTTTAELEVLHAEALDENYWLHTEEGRIRMRLMSEAGRRRARTLIGVASMLAVYP